VNFLTVFKKFQNFQVKLNMVEPKNFLFNSFTSACCQYTYIHTVLYVKIYTVLFQAAFILGHESFTDMYSFFKRCQSLENL
jgi:hypothetical protein